MSTQLGEIVRLERERRGLSVRQAATLGNISNTRWGEFEKRKAAPSGLIRQAVATTFGWPLDWVENPPPPPAPIVHPEVAARDDQLMTVILGLAAQVESLTAEVRELRRSAGQ